MRQTARVPQPGGMKIVNYATYIDSQERVAALRPAHREYMTQLLAEGRLVVGGPLTDGSGALFIYETESLATAEQIVAADPYKSAARTPATSSAPGRSSRRTRC